MVNLLDCTFRDGGYYTVWDFNKELVEMYFDAMKENNISFIELGFRSFEEKGFKGPFAYTNDRFIKTLNIPDNIKIGVMINAKELINYPEGINKGVQTLFNTAENSPVDLVRVACYANEFEKALEIGRILKKLGYIVGLNLMQITEVSFQELERLARRAKQSASTDVFYFADSLGKLKPQQVTEIIKVIRKEWTGSLGIHTHDNMGNALANSLQAIEDGVTWVDGTVTGMGRGPGNAKSEQLIVELSNCEVNLALFMRLIEEYFLPLKSKYRWGTNTYYYLAGKYGIHPTYIQEMIHDSTYDSSDILAVIEYLKNQSCSKFSRDILKEGLNFYENELTGQWDPKTEIENKEVLILGTGTGIQIYKEAIEEYIKVARPYVIALNTQNIIDSELIDLRAACHPSRLTADLKIHLELNQPLAIPFSMLSKEIQPLFRGKVIKDFGICAHKNTFEFNQYHCIVPKILVIAYALSIATSGKAKKILMAGFDGYYGEDKRNEEMNNLLHKYNNSVEAIPLKAITPTKYQINKGSIYYELERFVK